MASTPNMLDTHSKTDSARLVLAVGSRAGREAPVQHGYYMIGRDRECQIRPKSRSVSRRHCLLFHDDRGLQVLDLNSTSGTRVNDWRLRPHSWTSLGHGDVLRCGKVVFRVDLGQQQANHHRDSNSGTDDAKVMPVGEAWHDVDIAGFLESQDQVDQERRDHRIPTRGEQASTISQELSDDCQTTIEMDVDLDLFEDAFDDLQFPQSPSPQLQLGALTDSSATHASGATEADPLAPNEASPDKAASASRKEVASRFAKAAARKPLPAASTRRFLIRMPADADCWKVIGITLVMFSVMTTAGYSAYRVYSGPDVRVLHSID